jgi:hypothetical protein
MGSRATVMCDAHTARDPSARRVRWRPSLVILAVLLPLLLGLVGNLAAGSVQVHGAVETVGALPTKATGPQRLLHLRDRRSRQRQFPTSVT